MNDTNTIDKDNFDTEQHVAVEIMGMMPQIRNDLRISVQTYAGETCYVIEDTIGSKFFRLGLAEYTLVSLLDGKTTIAEAMGQTASITGEQALSERETGTLCKWLLDAGLATTSQSRGAARLSESHGNDAKRKLAGKANPIMQKLPLFNPMPLLRPIDRLSRMAFSPFAALIWMTVVGYGAFQVWTLRDDFVSAGTNLLSSSNWIYLILTWVGLKLIHELSHAMACRSFQGTVREAGIVFIVFAPMPYVDVTSVWRLDSKWKRIMVSGAGMYAEIFLAAIAAIVWATTFDPLVKQHCINVIVTATVVTLMFNANPLMRFDGYYMLTDWIEMPNLATHGRQWTSYFMRRYFMGVSVACPEWPEGKHFVVVSYAILAFMWRILISISIAISAEVLFHGAGIVLAVMAMAMWIAMPLYKSLKTLRETKTASYPRMASIVGTFAVVLWCLWSIVPWYSKASVPVVVDFHPAQEVRCGVSGFLVQNHVHVGDHVRKGQLLAELSNQALDTEYKNLQLELEQSIQRARDYRFSGAIAAVQVEQRHQASLDSRLAQVEKQLRALQVIAPSDGIVATTDTEYRQGTVVKAGDRLFLLGADDREKIYGLVAQSEIEAFQGKAGQPITVHVWGTGSRSFQGTIQRVLPRASTELKHAALGAHAGGPLTVRPKEQQQSSSDSTSNTNQVELVDPRFAVLIDFAGCDSEGVLPGQSGYAKLTYHNGTVGQVFIEGLRRWIRDKRQMMSQLSQMAQTEYQQNDLTDSGHPPTSS